MAPVTNINISSLNHFANQLCVYRSGLFRIWKRCSSVFVQSEGVADRHLSQSFQDIGVNVNKRRKQIIRHIIIQKSEIVNIFSHKANNANIDWKFVKQCMDEAVPGEYNHMLVIDLCYSYKNYDAVISYIKYLKDQGHEINLALQGRYLYTYYLRETPLTLPEEKDILSLIDEIKKNYECLDDITLKYVVAALSLTSRWRESLALLNTFAADDKNIFAKRAIAIAAFHNGNLDIGYEMLVQIFPYNLTPDKFIYQTHMDYCSKYDQNVVISEIERMFHCWAANEYAPHKSELDVYIEVLKKFEWQENDTEITSSGQCRFCGTHMKALTMTTQEFIQLSKAVLERVIIGDDIYHVTNPEELAAFKAFVEKTRPYDIVIDGLNLMYMSINKSKAGVQYFTVLNHFISKGWKICFLTRFHALRWLKPFYNHPQIHLYALNDSTKDDAYVLYAALRSGLSTLFMSADLMRQHKFTLQNADLQRMFKTWQLTHQYRIRDSQPNSNASLLGRLQYPLKYCRYAQKFNDVWHISWIDDEPRTDSYDNPQWICLLPPNKKKTFV